MLSSSVHPISIHPSHNQKLLTTTPATSKQQKLNMQRTLQRTTASKPRDFDIYIDNNSTSYDSDYKYTRSNFQNTPHHRLNQNNQSIKARLATSTKKTNTKPLEDKTNTVRKKSSRVRILDHSPTTHKSIGPEANHDTQMISIKKSSNSQVLVTPHPNKSLKFKKSPSTNQLSSSKNGLAKRLLYRTPVTCKRALHPPFAGTLGDEANDDDDNGEVSMVASDHSIDHLKFDFTQGDIPDVEYGPPSAIIEPIESLIDDQESEIKMLDFFKQLKNNPQNYMISHDDELPGSKFMTEVEEIMSFDGRKDKWLYEPRCEITNYAVDGLLDEFLIPSRSTRRSDVTTQSKRQPPVSSSLRSSRLAVTRSSSSSNLSGTTKPSTKPPTVISTRSKVPLTRHSSRNLVKAPSTSQMSNRPRSILPSVIEYQQLVQTLIDNHRSNALSDLDLLHSNVDDSLSCTFDSDLNSFQFDLLV